MKSTNSYQAAEDETVQYLWQKHKKFIGSKGQNFIEINACLYDEYKQTNSNEVKWDIVIANIPLIFEIIHSKWDDRFDFSDLLQEGLIGASIGVEKYIYGKGSTLESIIRIYCFKHVMHYISVYQNRVVKVTDFQSRKFNKSKSNGDVICNAVVDISLPVFGEIPDVADVDIDTALSSVIPMQYEELFYSYFRIKRKGRRNLNYGYICLKNGISNQEGERIAKLLAEKVHSHLKS